MVQQVHMSQVSPGLSLDYNCNNNSTGLIQDNTTDKDTFMKVLFLSAVIQVDLQAIKSLYNEGVPVDFYSPCGSPLIIAAKNGSLDAVKYLLESGSNVNQTDGKGWTALHWAASVNQIDTCIILLRRGANPDQKTTSGKTAGVIAHLQGFEELVNILDNYPCPKTIPTSITNNIQVDMVQNMGSMQVNDNMIMTPGSNYAESFSPSTSTVKRPAPFEACNKGEVWSAVGTTMLLDFMGDKRERKCAECGATDTPQWRRDEKGVVTLCNACGLKKVHVQNRDKKNARRREKYAQQKAQKASDVAANSATQREREGREHIASVIGDSVDLL